MDARVTRAFTPVFDGLCPRMTTFDHGVTTYRRAATDALWCGLQKSGSFVMTTYKDMIAAADALVPRLEPAQAKDMIEAGNVLVVDIRDGLELQQTGKLCCAVHIARGSLESRADPTSPTHNPVFTRDVTVIVHCAGGGRAALAGKTLREMGYAKVYNGGGFKDLAAAGIEVEKG
jgi:rhodanese-related sulfurtransferase